MAFMGEDMFSAPLLPLGMTDTLSDFSGLGDCFSGFRLRFTAQNTQYISNSRASSIKPPAAGTKTS